MLSSMKHHTQKPLAALRWCVLKWATDNWKVNLHDVHSSMDTKCGNPRFVLVVLAADITLPCVSLRTSMNGRKCTWQWIRKVEHLSSAQEHVDFHSIFLQQKWTEYVAERRRGTPNLAAGVQFLPKVMCKNHWARWIHTVLVYPAVISKMWASGSE